MPPEGHPAAEALAGQEARVDGQRLLSFSEARVFLGVGLTLEELVADLKLATTTAAGKPVQWDL